MLFKFRGCSMHRHRVELYEAITHEHELQAEASRTQNAATPSSCTPTYRDYFCWVCCGYPLEQRRPLCSISAKLLPHTASIHENMQCSAPNDCDHYTVQKEHHRTPPTKRRSGRDFQCRISHTNTDKPDQPREPRPQILPRPRHPFIHDQPSIPCGRLL